MRWWLFEEVPEQVSRRGGAVPKDLTVVTGHGKSRSQHQNASGRGRLHDRVGHLLQKMSIVHIPWRENPGNFVIDAEAWLHRVAQP